MKRRKGNLHGCCNPIFVPLSRQTLYYIPQRTRIPMRPEKSFFKKTIFAQTFFGSHRNVGVALECHTRLCFVTAVGLWPLCFDDKSANCVG